MSRRVLVLNHFAVPLGEPGGTRHTEMFRGLADWDHLIVAARTNPSTHLRQQSQRGFHLVPVTPFHSNGPSRVINWLSYALSATVWSLIHLRPRPHVVYASSPHLITAAAGAVLAMAFQTPLVLEIRDLWPKVLADMGQLTEKSTIHRLLIALESWLYHRADRIVVLAHGVARSLEQAGVATEKIMVVPNAADPERFDIEASRDDARALYGFDKLTFVYTGAHGPANGLDLLIDAAAEVGDSIDVVLVGDGLNRTALMKRAETMNLNNVRFLSAIPKAEIPGLLLAADVGIHCLADVPIFRYGVSPNKLFDYMAAAKPVLTNTLGDVGELVKDNAAGIGVPPTGLAAGIAHMAAVGPHELAQWGINGRRYITEHQSRKAMIDLLSDVLDGIRPRSSDSSPLTEG